MQFANIEWRQDTQNNAQSLPYSLDFNDVYFNTEDGVAETEHIFVAHNQLAERFSEPHLSSFTIIETGFGTGLNFLVVSDLWLKLAPKTASLHYIGIEKTPLSLADLTRAHALWPQFSSISNELITHYANLNAKLKSGTNYFSLAAGRMDVGLQADDIMLALPQLTKQADAWLLDGFAPAKNSAMWTSEVFAQIKRLSKCDTTFATFTSAGQVRRGLQAAGFKVNKHKGFGKKREMLSGVFLG
jgi:tRNA 5-methylaminomethyl-2-thiouridine biosynthesis bifunctional protein